MAFVIKYYREKKEIGSTPWADTLEKTKQIAADGLIRHSAELAVIFDDDGYEVATVSYRA